MFCSGVRSQGTGGRACRSGFRPDRGQESGIRSQEAGDGRRVLRAVFLNYLLDCLPAAMLEWDSDSTEVRQLYVRTCVGRNVRLADYTDLTPKQLRERATRLTPHPPPLSPEYRGEGSLAPPRPQG